MCGIRSLIERSNEYEYEYAYEYEYEYGTIAHGTGLTQAVHNRVVRDR